MSRPTSRRTLFPAHTIAGRIVSAFEQFLHIEAASGVVLLVTAVAALIWANSPYADAYHDLWHDQRTLSLAAVTISQPLHFWINDGLMTLFFLVVGLEIRREIHDGALANVRLASVPLVAALGGIAVPALIYVVMNDDPAALRGWAAPTATDIAFAIGVLSLLGSSVPRSVRVFLLALAIIDDIVAVVIIALFYSGGLSTAGLPIVLAGLVAVLVFQRIGIRSAYAYCLPAVVLWLGLLRTGLHPTLTGVMLGLLTPMRSPATSEPPAVRVQERLHPWVAFAIMPLFALANAGVTLEGVNFTSETSLGVTFGIVVALVVGKPVGIFFSSWLAARLGWVQLADDLPWRGVLLAGCLGGIGFTMSIFISTLAFADSELLAAAKAGVLLASLCAGIAGITYGYLAFRVRKR